MYALLKYACYGKENSLGNAVIFSVCITCGSYKGKVIKVKNREKNIECKTSTDVIQNQKHK